VAPAACRARAPMSPATIKNHGSHLEKKIPLYNHCFASSKWLEYYCYA
jgi:hypothetical protein